MTKAPYRKFQVTLFDDREVVGYWQKNGVPGALLDADADDEEGYYSLSLTNNTHHLSPVVGCLKMCRSTYNGDVYMAYECAEDGYSPGINLGVYDNLLSAIEGVLLSFDASVIAHQAKQEQD